MWLADLAPFLSKSAPIELLGVALSFTLNFPHGTCTERIDMNTFRFEVERVDYRSPRSFDQTIAAFEQEVPAPDMPPLCSPAKQLFVATSRLTRERSLCTEPGLVCITWDRISF
jgi:hypothetical protein